MMRRVSVAMLPSQQYALHPRSRSRLSRVNAVWIIRGVGVAKVAGMRFLSPIMRVSAHDW
jgi:hypothetical protein